MKPELLPISRLRLLIQLGRRLGLSTLLWLSLPESMVKAQVVPDGSLESAVQQIQELMKINGGQRAGNNLFHSFEEFSIPAGMEATFENATDIENIFTRVTGDSVSAIDGILSTQGGANLFLMNPNGIVFGTDASIDVGGSFIATTADSIQFADGKEFAASDTENDALINVGFPAAFGFNKEPEGSITVNGTGNEITPSFSSSETQVKENSNGIEVESGNTLGLIGNGITVDGGTINASGGNIELGSVGTGVVEVQPTENGFAFNYDNVNSYKNIDLTDLSLVSASGVESGAISLTGEQVGIKNGSLVLVQNKGNAPSGTINVDALDTLTLSGTSNDGNVSSAVLSETLDSGNGADIDVTARNTSLKDGARINASTYSDARGGSIGITSAMSVQLLDNSLVNLDRQSFTVSGISTVAYDSGDGGNVKLSTTDLRVTNGNSVQSSASGSGNGGDLMVDSETVEITGISQNTERISPSALAASVNSGEAGNLTINTSKLKILDGGAISSSTYGTGIAGNININSASITEVSGENNNQTSRISASVVSVSNAVKERLNLPDVPSGRGGNLNINTPFLNIVQGGEVSVGNVGTGNAGTLSLNTAQLNLAEAGKIIATTESGLGGEIIVNAGSLLLDSGSKITASAENEGGGGNININALNISAKKNSAISVNAIGGDGGNITIETDTLLGLDNSDITANAVGGNGGNINIAADAIVGFEQRARLTPLSDITASSDFGTSGVININTPESSADEEVEVAAREVNSNDITKEFAQSCRQGRGQFTYTAVGVPESPDRYFDDSGEYGTEEVSNLPTRSSKYPPLGQPQSEAHRRELGRPARIN